MRSDLSKLQQLECGGDYLHTLAFRTHFKSFLGIYYSLPQVSSHVHDFLLSPKLDYKPLKAVAKERTCPSAS